MKNVTLVNSDTFHMSHTHVIHVNIQCSLIKYDCFKCGNVSLLKISLFHNSLLSQARQGDTTGLSFKQTLSRLVNSNNFQLQCFGQTNNSMRNIPGMILMVSSCQHLVFLMSSFANIIFPSEIQSGNMARSAKLWSLSKFP